MVDNLKKLDAVISDLEAQASSHAEFAGVLNEIARLTESLDELSTKYVETSSYHENINRKLDESIDETRATTLATQASLSRATTKLGKAVVEMQTQLSSHQEEVTNRAIVDIKCHTDIAKRAISKTLEENISRNNEKVIERQNMFFDTVVEHQQKIEVQLDEKLRATNRRVLVVVTVALLTAIFGALAVTH